MAKKSAKKKPGRTPAKQVGQQRLNKILAAAGLGSRREVEELILQGRVEVDRETVTELSSKYDPKEVTIKVDGQALRRSKLVYYALNKPKGVLSTNRDPSGRIRVVDLVPDDARVFSVGRLDRNSEGLTLLTNDGELAQRLAHPKFRIQKTYFVVVAGLMEQVELDKLKKGVYLAEGFARIDGATIKKHRKGCTELEIVLSEGKNREIRRILARSGHKVVLLRRVAIATLKLGQIPVGASRQLTSTEVKKLYAVTERGDVPKRGAGKAKAARGGAGRKSKSRTSNPEQSEMLIEEEPINAFLDDDYDDDFVGDFSGVGSVGSVIAFDEDAAEVETEASEGDSTPRRRSASKRGVEKRGTQARSSSRRSSAGRASASGSTGRSGTGRASSGTGRGTKAKSSGRRASAKGSAKENVAARSDRSSNSKVSRKSAATGGKRVAGSKSKTPVKRGTSARGTSSRGGGRAKSPTAGGKIRKGKR